VTVFSGVLNLDQGLNYDLAFFRLVVPTLFKVRQVSRDHSPLAGGQVAGFKSPIDERSILVMGQICPFSCFILMSPGCCLEPQKEKA
jgi:hypothetical protein